VLKRSILAFPFVLAALPLVLTIPGEVILSKCLVVDGQHYLSRAERFISITQILDIMQATVMLASSTPSRPAGRHVHRRSRLVVHFD
jgi:hypothetical protein